MSHKKQAHVTSAKADFKNVHLAVEALAADTEKRPGPSTVGQTADQGIRDLATDDAGLISATNAFINWKGPYIQSIPQDPWGNNYFFDPDDYIDGNAVPVVGSFGPNGQGQNDYDPDDVYRILPFPVKAAVLRIGPKHL